MLVASTILYPLYFNLFNSSAKTSTLALKVGTSLESKFIIDFTLKSFIGFGKSVFNTNFLPSDKKSKSLYVYNNFP